MFTEPAHSCWRDQSYIKFPANYSLLTERVTFNQNVTRLH